MGEMTALMVGQGVSAAAGAANSVSQAQALRGQQSYENVMTRLNASRLIERGQIAGSRASLQASQLAGAQRAGYAAGGVDVNSGSAAAIQGETQMMGEVERLAIMANAQDQALGLRAQNELNQIGTRFKIHSSIAESGMNVASSAARMGATYEYYQGLDANGKPRVKPS